MINVCLACDDNYAKYAGVVIASILDSANPDDSLCFYILDGGIKSKNKDKILALKDIKDCEIKFVPIDNSLFTDYMDVRTHEYISIPTFYRLKLPTLLPNVKRVIYFDCDFVVTSSLAKLFNVNMGDYPIAGVKDISKKLTKINPNYVNAGMLVMDITNLKKAGAEEIFLNWTKEHFDTIKLGDQEIINEALKGKIMLVEDEWNVQSSNFTNRSSYTRTPKAIHFVAKKKPWHYASFSVHRPLYFKYLQLTPWKLSEKDLKHWTHDNQIASLIEYVKYRPLFLFRPRFYEALFETYIKPCFEYKKPVIKSKTFIVWEPCSKSHSEVVPGYVKYLLDLGYHVSVIVNPQHYKSGLFSRFEDKNLTLNKMSRKEVKEFFRNPKTKTAALLSGCKNICAVEAMESHRDGNWLWTSDWGVGIRVSKEALQARTIGIRAHFFTKEKPSEGCYSEFPVGEYRIMEDPFEWNVSFRKDRSCEWLQWKTAKTDWDPSEGVPEKLYVKEENLLLLDIDTDNRR